MQLGSDTMKRLMALVLSVMVVALSGCNDYRFEDKSSTDYADEYNFETVYFQEQTTLRFLNDIKRFEDDEENPYDDHLDEDLKVIYGSIDGEDHFLFVPHNDEWDVELMESPFPPFERTLEAAREHVDSKEEGPDLTLFREMVCEDCLTAESEEASWSDYRLTTTTSFPRSEGFSSMSVTLLEEQLESNIVIVIGQLTDGSSPRIAFMGMLENGNVGIIAINPPATEAFTTEYEFTVED